MAEQRRANAELETLQTSAVFVRDLVLGGAGGRSSQGVGAHFGLVPNNFHRPKHPTEVITVTSASQWYADESLGNFRRLDLTDENCLIFVGFF
jgi:hypothetical protein